MLLWSSDVLFRSNISLNFFGEQVSINVPTDLSSLRKEIADKFMFSPSDAAEIVLSYMKDLGKKIIKTEQDFTTFISNKIGKIDLDISPNSKLFLKNFDTLKKESEEAQKELDERLKKKEEMKKEKEAKLNEKREKIKIIEKKLKKLLKQKKALKIQIIKEKKTLETEEKENDEKIKQLKEKLGIKEEKKNCEKNKKKKLKLRGKKKENKKEIHSLVSCDGCHMNPLIGRRYKCETCPNFDFCEACYKKEKEKHGHQFKVVETKELVKEILEKVSPKPKNSEGKPVHRWISCNGCGMNPIVGVRYKCSACDNFDYCENCVEIYKNEHSHQFIKISKPNIDF